MLKEISSKVMNIIYLWIVKEVTMSISDIVYYI
mgnify:FL=1